MIMKRLFFPFMLFFLLVCEGIALDLLPAVLTSAEIYIIPHWVLIFLILVSLFYDGEETFYAIIYGVCFGLLIDIVYTGVLGVYMFVYPFSLYIVHLLKRILQTNLVMTLFNAMLAIIVTELLLLFIFSIVGIIDISRADFILTRLLPTLLANLLFLIPLYFLFRKPFRKWATEQFDK